MYKAYIRITHTQLFASKCLVMLVVFIPNYRVIYPRVRKINILFKYKIAE